MIIAFNYPGTVMHNGKPVKYAIDSLRELQNNHSLILLTPSLGGFLRDEMKYLVTNGIRPWGINVNPDDNEANYIRYDLLIDVKSVNAPVLDNGAIDWILVMKFIKKLS